MYTAAIFICKLQGASLKSQKNILAFMQETRDFSFTHCARYCFFQKYNGTLVGNSCNTPVPDVFLMSIILFMGTFLMSVEFKDFKNALFFPSKVKYST